MSDSVQSSRQRRGQQSVRPTFGPIHIARLAAFRSGQTEVVVEENATSNAENNATSNAESNALQVNQVSDD
jgi:hypothetical protein